MNTVCIVTLPDQASPDIPRFLFHEPPPSPPPPKVPPPQQPSNHIGGGAGSRSHSNPPSAGADVVTREMKTVGGDVLSAADLKEISDGWDEGEVPPKEYYRSVMEREFALANQLQRITLQTGVSATLQLAQRAALAKLEKEKREVMTQEFILDQTVRTRHALLAHNGDVSAGSLQPSEGSATSATFRNSSPSSMHDSQSRRRKTTVTESEAAAGVVADRWADVRPSTINPVFTFGIPQDLTPQLSCWVDSFSVMRHECPVNTVLTAKRSPVSSGSNFHSRNQTSANNSVEDAGSDLIMNLGFSPAALDEHEIASVSSSKKGSASPLTRTTSDVYKTSPRPHRRPAKNRRNGSAGGRNADYTLSKSLALRRSILDDVCHYGSLHTQLYSVLRQSVTEGLWDVGEVTFLIHGNGFDCPIVNLLSAGGVIDALLADVVQESSKRQIAEVFGVELAISASLIDSRSGNVIDLCPASVGGGQPLKQPTLIVKTPSAQEKEEAVKISDANRRRDSSISTVKHPTQVEKHFYYYSPLTFSDAPGQTVAGGSVAGFKTPSPHQAKSTVEAAAVSGALTLVDQSTIATPASESLLNAASAIKPTTASTLPRSSRRGGAQAPDSSATATPTFVANAPPPAPHDPLSNETMVNIESSGDHYCDLHTDKIRRQRRAFFAAERLRPDDLTTLLSSIGSQWEANTTPATPTETPLGAEGFTRCPSAISTANNSMMSLAATPTAGAVGKIPMHRTAALPSLPHPQHQGGGANGRIPTSISSTTTNPPVKGTEEDDESGLHVHYPQREKSALHLVISLTKKCSIMPRQTATVRFIVVKDQAEMVHKLLTTATTKVPLHNSAGDYCRTLAHLLPVKASLNDLPKKMVFINIVPIEKLPQSLTLLAAAKGLPDGPHTHLDHATPDVIKAVDTFKDERQTLARAYETLQRDNDMFQGKIKSLLRRLKLVEGNLKTRSSRNGGVGGGMIGNSHQTPRGSLSQRKKSSKGGVFGEESDIHGAFISSTNSNADNSVNGGSQTGSTSPGLRRRGSRRTSHVADLTSMEIDPAAAAMAETSSSTANVSAGRQNCTVMVNDEEYTFLDEGLSTDASIVLTDIQDIQLKIDTIERDLGETLRKATRDNTILVEERDMLQKQNVSLRYQKSSLEEKVEVLSCSNKLAEDHLRQNVLLELTRNAELIGIDTETLHTIIEETCQRSVLNVGLVPVGGFKKKSNEPSVSASQQLQEASFSQGSASGFSVIMNNGKEEGDNKMATKQRGSGQGTLKPLRRPVSSSTKLNSMKRVNGSNISPSSDDVDTNYTIASPWPESAPIRVPHTTLPAAACVNSPDDVAPAKYMAGAAETADSRQIRDSMKSYLTVSRDLHLQCAAANQKRTVAVGEAQTVQHFAEALKSVLLQYTSTIAAPQNKVKYPQLNQLLRRHIVQEAVAVNIDNVDASVKEVSMDDQTRKKIQY